MVTSGCGAVDGGEPYEAGASAVEAADVDKGLPYESPAQTPEAVEAADVTASSTGTCPQCWQESMYVCGYPTFSCPFGWYNYFPPATGCGWCYRNACTSVPLTGSISANPTTVNINTGSSTGCTNISWNAACGTAQVYVSHNGGGETLFAQDRSGTQGACWIQPGSQYDFCLYEGTSHSNNLGCVRVVGVDAGPAPDPCDSCNPGTSCFCGDGVCRSNNTYCP